MPGQTASRGPSDPSRGYDALAGEFVKRRDPAIGVAVVREWARALPSGGTVLDIGCGHGVPISRTLIEDGFRVHGVDASPALVAAYRERFPTAPVVCEAAEHSGFFGRTFDGVVAWGLLFLLEPETQVALIHRVASALAPGGRFLFTSPEQVFSWTDVMTGRESLSLGREVYAATLEEAGLRLVAEREDEAGNHYYESLKQ